jgi:type II secretion system protein J
MKMRATSFEVNNSHARTSRAFTLLEIMVALMLFGLLATAIYSSWMALMKGSKVGLVAAAKVQRSRIAMQTIEEALSSARSFDADNQYYSFIGENGAEATLSFVCKLSESFPRSGKFGDFDVRRVTFSLEPGADSNEGKRLVLRQNPILMDLDSDEKDHPVVLAKDVKTFAMEFWDTRPQKNQNGNTYDWLDEWDETNRLPAMVKITLEFAGDATGQNAQEHVKVVALPSMAVPSAWQRVGGLPGTGPGGPGGPALPPPTFQPKR